MLALEQEQVELLGDAVDGGAAHVRPPWAGRDALDLLEEVPPAAVGERVRLRVGEVGWDGQLGVVGEGHALTAS